MRGFVRTEALFFEILSKPMESLSFHLSKKASCGLDGRQESIIGSLHYCRYHHFISDWRIHVTVGILKLFTKP